MTRDQAADESPGRMGGTRQRRARFFDSPEEFGAWLALHHDTAGLRASVAVARLLATLPPGVVVDALSDRVDPPPTQRLG